MGVEVGNIPQAYILTFFVGNWMKSSTFGVGLIAKLVNPALSSRIHLFWHHSCFQKHSHSPSFLLLPQGNLNGKLEHSLLPSIAASMTTQCNYDPSCKFLTLWKPDFFLFQIFLPLNVRKFKLWHIFIHGSHCSGRVCIPIDPHNSDDFDVTAVPTLTEDDWHLKCQVHDACHSVQLVIKGSFAVFFRCKGHSSIPQPDGRILICS